MVVILSIVVVDVNTRTWSYCLVFSAISFAKSASVCAFTFGLDRVVPFCNYTGLIYRIFFSVGLNNLPL